MVQQDAKLTEFTDAQRAEALRQFQIIRPFLEDGVPLTRIAIAQKLHIRTLRRWVQRYRASGLIGLVRLMRKDKGQKRAVTADLQQLIEGLALQKPQRAIANIQREVSRIAKEQGWKAPSYSTVERIVQHLDPALVTFAHQGSKVYREEFDLLYRREASHPNAMWQADHTLLDIWVFDEKDQPAKPWLTIILDDYSRSIAGYRIGFQAPSALQTALTLRQAIWRKQDAQWHICGIPSTFYTDHGSDFTSQHLEQVGSDLKMELIFSQFGIPRGRGKIERFFSTVNQLLLSHLAGYCPAGSEESTAFLTLSAFEARFRAWLLEDYHYRPQKEINGAPQERWEAGGFLPRMPESLEQLDLLLLTVAKVRRVHQDGIRFQGFRYLDLTLAGYVGEDALIRYDPLDMAEIRIFMEETFICRAVCQELAGQTISLKDIIQARTQQRKQVQAGINERAAIVERFLAVHQPDPLPEGEVTPPPPQTTHRLKRYMNE
ncbi:MAG: Mu transposase C-terminal domain-containing protein [Ktedonobacteraceae bacterium]